MCEMSDKKQLQKLTFHRLQFGHNFSPEIGFFCSIANRQIKDLSLSMYSEELHDCFMFLALETEMPETVHLHP